LHDGLPDADAMGTALVMAAIQGMAGVGKTRLAVHFAHQLVAAGRYADIQLFVDLNGRAKQPPADPSAFLASFLALLGVPTSQIPQSLDARAALYRERLHGTRALVILDNAADEDQLRPLLPGSPASLVLITSRRTVALDGATTYALDVFTRSQAESCSHASPDGNGLLPIPPRPGVSLMRAAGCRWPSPWPRAGCRAVRSGVSPIWLPDSRRPVTGSVS
jgi:predicted ATPase